MIHAGLLHAVLISRFLVLNRTYIQYCCRRTEFLAFINLLGNAGVALGAKTLLRIVGDILLDILYISVARACPLSNVTKHIEVSLNNFRDRVKILPLILSELT